MNRTCKDCVYYDACKLYIEEANIAVDKCNIGFKPNDQYVWLPVYVGQDIWEVYQNTYSKQVTIIKGKVAMIQQKADKSWKFRVSHTGSVYDCTLDKIGNTIFLDKDSANIKADELRRATKNEER